MEKRISRIEKLNGIKNSKKVDAFLFTSASSVKYFSGYFFYFEYGSSPFQLVPAVLMVVPGLDATLILADNEAGQSSSVDPDIEVHLYESYTYEKAPDPAGACMERIRTFIRKNKLESAAIGVEINSLPFIVSKTLQEEFPFIEWVDIAAEIDVLKSVKDPDEIEFIRAAARLADVGQQAVLKYACDGMTELELFSLAHRDMESVTGYRVPLMADLSSGVGTSSGGGMPTNKKIKTGDLILSDFTPCMNGYWGDSCNTMVVGEPTADQRRTFLFVGEALHMAIEKIKPGVQASSLDRLMRAHIGGYPHHGGHGVGTLYHESPRIVDYNDTVLVPDMVIALEPAIYKESYGIRLEHLVRVTKTGSEILTKFQHQFER
jgi:Xaa-Pro dipeptidase